MGMRITSVSSLFQEPASILVHQDLPSVGSVEVASEIKRVDDHAWGELA
jgi:hypothetical protein